MALTALLLAFLSISFADAVIPRTMLRMIPRLAKYPIHNDRPFVNSKGIPLPPLRNVHYFDQLVDHSSPASGTFRQRYWVNWEFYEAGGPIFLMAPQEGNGEEYLGLITNASIIGMAAQHQRGASVYLEHRFFGYSNPYENLTSQSLQLLTVEQAIGDIAHFAQNVRLSIPGDGSVGPGTAPWVLFGGSYSGALVSWTMVNNGDVFRAGYASSAVVEAISDFYKYFLPILDYMPKNCSADLQAVIAYLGKKYLERDAVAIHSLKQAFGLAGLSHVDDFAAALLMVLSYWQDLQPHSPGEGSTFSEFCDTLEVKNGVTAPASGWGLENAIQAYGSFWNQTLYPKLCSELDPETCLGTYNTSQVVWTNVAVDNYVRSWTWLMCNQLGFFAVGPPWSTNEPAIVSRIIQPAYYERQCVNMFPQHFSSPPKPPTQSINVKYHGWDLRVDRLFFANGRRDPWLDATVSAGGLDKASTASQPIYESDGFHCSDLLAANGRVDSTVHAVQMAALRYMQTWLA